MVVDGMKVVGGDTSECPCCCFFHLDGTVCCFSASALTSVARVWLLTPLFSSPSFPPFSPHLRLSMTTAVCFDFDGTLGDTESPAMEVAFWEVAAYLPSLPVGKEEGKEGGREGGKNPCV